MCPRRMEKLNLAPALTDATLDRTAQKNDCKMEKRGPIPFHLMLKKKENRERLFIFSPHYSLNFLLGVIFPDDM